MTDKDYRALQAARLYFLKGLSQAEVASELHISRPTASKLIQYARNKGYVTITVNDPGQDKLRIERQLQKIYNLQQVRLCNPTDPSLQSLITALGETGASMISALVEDGTNLGLTWGNTMYSIARHLKRRNTHGVEIIQLKGGLSFTSWETNDTTTMNLFCAAFNAYGRFLPLPIVFDSPEIKRLVENERFISRILEKGREADMAIFTVGPSKPEAPLFRSGYMTDQEKTFLLKNAVGDICSRFFQKDGAPCRSSFDDRTVGITLTELEKKPVRLLVAGGLHKVDAMEAALQHGYATHFVTDILSAQTLIGRSRN